MAAYAQTTTRTSRVLIGLTALWGFLGLAGIESWAGDDETTRATLRGIEGVLVAVEDLGSDVEQAGLTRQQLQTDVELRLRHAGIRVLTQAERLGMPGAPYLYINVNVYLRSEIPLVAFSIDVTLKQKAFLATDGSLATVSTWDVSQTGSTGRQRLSEIRNNVRDKVEAFINAYLSVHSRPTGSAAPPATSPRRPRER
jgi:hypothetical protein